MKWDKSELREAIKSKDQRIKNYFDTFGIVVIKGMLDRRDFRKLLAEYDHQYKIRTPALLQTKETLAKSLGLSLMKHSALLGMLVASQKILRPLFRLVKRRPMRFLPNFVDSSSLFMERFFNEEMMEVYRYLAGEKFLYMGSDGSHFVTTSFPWHRDWFTKMPIMKFNFYFNPLPFFGGRFMAIPGSNFAGDNYAGFLQKGMAWPLQNQAPGGLSENDFLPEFVNPRITLGGAIRQRIKVLFGMAKDLPDVPHIAIKVSKGDVVIFDQRLIHCVQSNFPPFSRRLLTVLLAKNAYEFSDQHYLLKAGNTRESLMKELVDLTVAERNHIDCPAYGDAIYEHPISSSQHFINIEKKTTGTLADQSRYNFGSFQIKNGEKFESELDVHLYAKNGVDFRKDRGESQKSAGDKLAQDYSFGDVHLGINSGNVESVHNN